ncbi:MAG TPA: zinc-binding dehydrogenase [Microlunatus sp.]|nr:zinc-binding dehydrogenase [Microlunatus sp.]
MKALMLLADGRVEVRDHPRPTPGQDEVLVRVAAAGVCGSDLHMWRGTQSWPTAPPVVLGHEVSGVIADVGADVVEWQQGERVVCETAARICGRCRLCRTGLYNLCPEREGYGATIDGAFAEYMVAPTRVLHRIPPETPFPTAALTEPMSVAFNALVERTQIKPGDTVVVQGAGAIGMFALQISRLHGAGQVLVLGTPVDRHRLGVAMQIGADHALDITDAPVADLVDDLTAGLGADLVVDATGTSAALRDSLDLVRPGGQIVKIGWGPEPLRFSLDPLVQKAVTLHGSFSHTWQTWERVLQLQARGQLDAAAVIGGTYPLPEWQTAFDDMHAGRVIKSVLTVDPADRNDAGGVSGR